ncbi:MAG TPA: PIG-L family deacetylase [Terriglobales bacterium]|nr:PIG-L family deacetylase [Terriglobales bacterium]
MKISTARCVIAVIVLTVSGWAQMKQAPPYPAPDERYKADILVVVAHPDDDMGAAPYVARAMDQGKRAAVIFCTRGNSGSNYVGNEQATSLGAIREVEGRRAEAALGVYNVWFLNGPDTPGQDVLHSLEAWGHGSALEQVVRLVRLTRPEVIITWLPDYVAGENHDDHQAAGVLATEAFDLAGDSLAFPEQVEAPRNRLSINNYGEGLHPWQPQKIYYFTDASHEEFVKGKGPEYRTDEISPTRHVSYGEVVYEAWMHDKSQIGPEFSEATVKEYLARPMRYIFGKSVVGGSPTGDIMENTKAEGVPWVPVMGHHAVAGPEEGLQLGGPWAFYRDFWPQHNLEHLGSLLAPETAMGTADFHLWVPLILRNTSGSAEQVSLQSSLPVGWTQTSEPMVYSLAAHEERPVSIFLVAPQSQKGSWQTLKFAAEAGGRSIGSVTLKANVEYNGVPQ